DRLVARERSSAQIVGTGREGTGAEHREAGDVGAGLGGGEGGRGSVEDHFVAGRGAAGDRLGGVGGDGDHFLAGPGRTVERRHLIVDRDGDRTAAGVGDGGQVGRGDEVTAVVQAGGAADG